VAGTARVDGAPLGSQAIHSTSVSLSPPGIGSQAQGEHLLEMRATNGGQPAWRAYRNVVIE
jgi:hypothetical protein